MLPVLAAAHYASAAVESLWACPERRAKGRLVSIYIKIGADYFLISIKNAQFCFDNKVERVARIKGLNMSKEQKNACTWQPEGILSKIAENSGWLNFTNLPKNDTNAAENNIIPFLNAEEKEKSQKKAEITEELTGADVNPKTDGNTNSGSLAETLTKTEKLTTESISASDWQGNTYNITLNLSNGLIGNVNNSPCDIDESPESADDFMDKLANALQAISGDVKNYATT